MKIFITINNIKKEVVFVNSQQNDESKEYIVINTDINNIYQLTKLFTPDKPFFNINCSILYIFYSLFPIIIQHLKLLNQLSFTILFYENNNEFIELYFNKLFEKKYSDKYMFIYYNIVYNITINNKSIIKNKHITINLKNDSLLEISNILVSKILKYFNKSNKLLLDNSFINELTK